MATDPAPRPSPFPHRTSFPRRRRSPRPQAAGRKALSYVALRRKLTQATGSGVTNVRRTVVEAPRDEPDAVIFLIFSALGLIDRSADEQYRRRMRAFWGTL